MEIRSEEWFKNKEKFSSLLKELNTIDKGIVISDTPGRRDAVHMMLSNGTAFIRFNCFGYHELDHFRIQQWKKVLRSWYLQGLNKCYFFLHVADKKSETAFSNYVQKELGELIS